MRKWRRRQERQQHRRWLAGLDRYSISALPEWVFTTIGGAFAIGMLIAIYMAAGFLRAYAKHKIFGD